MRMRFSRLTESARRLIASVQSWTRSERSQGLTEFALIAPIILLLTFGIIDFGRGLYFYITLQQAANEGARVAVRASYFIDPNGSTHTWPTDADVAAAVQAHAVTEVLANPCPNGPIPNGGVPAGSPSLPPPNSGWIFITDPSLAGNGVPNGPRGGLGTLPAPGPGCNTITPAVGNEPIKVTLWFNFQPLTPLIQQVVGNQIVITAYAVYRAEYSN
jgi:TadE-like protein